MEDIFEVQEPTQDTPKEQPESIVEDASNRFLEASEEETAASEHPPVEASEEEETQDNWEVRARHFQSEYDRMKGELEQLRTQTEEVNPWKPLINKLQENPTALKAVAEILEKGTVSQEPSLAPPELPSKPSGYSHYEAMNDPESESAKYEQSVIEYNAQFAEYTRAREEQRAMEEQQRKMAEQQTLQQQTYLKQVYNTVQADYGLRPQEAAEFLQMMSSPESIDIKNLVGYFKYLKGGVQQHGKPPVPSRTSQQTPPPPGAVGGSSGGKEPTTQESFVNGLKASGRNLFETI